MSSGRDLFRFGLRVLGIAVVVFGLVGGVVLLKVQADHRRNARPKPDLVVDRTSGITWEMYGTPKVDTATSNLAMDAGTGGPLPVRTYTVDHGDWVERVQVYDASPGQLDYTQAALATFGADTGGQLGELEYVKIGDGTDAATGTASATILTDGTKQDAVAQVFVAQVNNHVVTGGVAQRVGASDVDVTEEAANLRTGLHPV